MKRMLGLLAFLVLIQPSLAQKKTDYSRWVNPFIGTGGHGHTYPGPTLPFGMVQLSPDTRLTGWDGCSGYHYTDSVVYGFSHTHLSGTGVADYGDILFMPTTGTPKFKNNEYASRFQKKNEKASAGYYETFLDSYQIGVKLTSTLRAGLHQYEFPKTAEANIIIDLQHRDEVLESWIEVVNDHEIRGFRRSNAWASNQPIYFYAKFNKPFKSHGIALNDLLQPGLKKGSGKNVKLYIQFNNPGKVLAKVGISAVSAEGALQNLNTEIPDFNFKKTENQAKAAWNKELSKIAVESTDKNKLSIFYTALYHCFSSPNLFMDVDGKYFGTDKKIHQAEGFDNYTVFSLWDTYRTEHPLLSIIDRKRTTDFINTFLNQHKNGGLLPIWELAGNETYCMIGNHSIPVILDAYRKGITGFDANLAFEAMKSAVNRNQFGLDSYRNNGLVLADDEHESVSKTLEYAYDDWCVAQFAKLLNKPAEYTEFIRRAQYWKNVFDSESGFMKARSNGNWWKPFDPTEVNNNFTEANSWQYTFYVPQDVETLIKAYGGTTAFQKKLDELFSTTQGLSGRGQVDITGLIGQYAHGNEPSHHMAYLYNFTNTPNKTAYYVQKIRQELYKNTPDGLSGNEDCGQMSAWLVMSALGFYPLNPASNQYTFGTPWFKKASIHLENGKSIEITAPDYSDESYYLQAISLNGQAFNQSYINFDDFKDGAALNFVTGKLPAETYTQSLKKPESRIDDEQIVSNPIIESAGPTFADKLSVSIKNMQSGASIYYTNDGSTPTLQSKVYEGALTLTESGNITASSYANGQWSFPTTAHFFKIPGDKKIKISAPTMKSYTAGGEQGLVDGIRGKANFRLGNLWQGYQSTDFEAIVELDKIKKVSSISTGFMQDTRSWIIFPTEVSYWGSTDGINYQHLGDLKNNIAADNYEVLIKEFELPVSQALKYIKVLAKNYGALPAWHLGYGEGGDAILFIDEISVR